MARQYYVCLVRMNESNNYVIWYQDEPDGFVRDDHGGLIVAPSFDTLAFAAAAVGLPPIADDVTEYDFDQLRTWCMRPTAEGVECKAFLNSWNFFDDLAGLHENRPGPYANISWAAQETYDKLFHGNNLPSFTPPGERFIPLWDAEELHSIRQVMEAGLRLVEAELQDAAV